MSKNDKEKGLKLERTVLAELQRSGFETYPVMGDEGVDFLATRDHCIFAVQVKGRPLESFDIVSGSTVTPSTIQRSLERTPEYLNKDVIPVLVSGYVVNESSRVFANQMGVIATDSSKVADTLRAACSTRGVQATRQQEQE